MGLQSPLRQIERQSISSSSSEVPEKNASHQGLLSKFRRRVVEPLRSSMHPPWFDARGMAVGLFVGFGIPIGAQMIFLALLRLLFRFNSVMAFALTWVNNPITLLPMYYGFYCVGSIILGKSVIMNVDDFRNLMRPIMHAGYFLDSVRSFLYLGGDLLERWAVGALSVGAVSGTIGYVVGYRVRKKRCRRRAHQLGTTYENLVRKLEANARRDGGQKTRIQGPARFTDTPSDS
jgi:uncharacterized protein